MNVIIKSNFKNVMDNYGISGYIVERKAVELGLPVRLATFYDLMNDNSRSLRISTIENILTVVNTLLKERNTTDRVVFSDLFTTIIDDWL